MRRIQIHNTHSLVGIKKRPIQKFARSVLRQEQIKEADITLVFVDHDYITGLNRKFLNTDKTTDVISFPLGEDDTDLIAEVYVNLDQVAAQATEFNITFFHELYRIVVHGILHVLGYDDLQPAQKTVMTKREDYYLNQLFKEEK